jgi:hypothetical protein
MQHRTGEEFGAFWKKEVVFRCVFREIEQPKEECWWIKA